MTITIELPPEVADALAHQAIQEGQDVAGYVRHLAVVASNKNKNEQRQDKVASRIPGLHAGQYLIAEDFDAPLPDSFWLGEEETGAVHNT